ncbi:hypothetical protein C8T65DRAFT_740746 [Cerioporus squamosus]|nr:hypothetical protein C8T65DRAFT_740746 [Cerioporus squamosus]
MEHRPWWKGYGTYGSPSHRMKFTLICSAWLPRARRLLYYAPILRKCSQLELFIRTITGDPELADMVHELVIDPDEPRTYIPFVRDTLFKRLRHLNTLVFGFPSGMTWVYPPRHHLLVARLPITELALHYQEFRSPFRTVWLETFRLVWSLRHLRRLHLDMQCESAPQLTDEDMRRLTAIRRPWACANLKTLVLDGWDYHDVLPEGAFGASVEQLSLHVYGNEISKSDAFFTQMSQFSALHDLYIGIEAGNGKPWEEDSATARYIVPIVTHLPAQDTLTAITIRIDDGGGHQREQFLEELSWHRLGGLLSTKFPRLGSVCFRLPERFDSAYDAERWRGLFDEYLPELRGIVSVAAKTYHRDNWRHVPHASLVVLSCLTNCVTLLCFDRTERLCWADDLESDDDLESGRSEDSCVARSTHSDYVALHDSPGSIDGGDIITEPRDELRDDL